MPAWLAPQRDDEVWAVVAFLERLPELSAPEYRRLALGPDRATPPDAQHREPSSKLTRALAECARCHDRDGDGRGEGAFPLLAGQSEQYLFAALRAYADGDRYSGMMQSAASGHDLDTLRRLARHFATQQPAKSLNTAREPTTFAAGRDLAGRGLPRSGVPSCVPCHGPSHAPRNAYYPLLAGQHYDYLVQQLQLFRDNRRGGSPFSPVMDAAAHRLTPEQIHAVSHYYATLAPSASTARAPRPASAPMCTGSGFRNATAEPTAAPVFKRGSGNL